MKCEQTYIPKPYIEPLVDRILRWTILSLSCFLLIVAIVFVFWVHDAIQKEGGYSINGAFRDGR